MSKDSISIEDGVATFNINVVGETSGQTYLGVFKVKCVLDPIGFIKSDQKYRELLGAIHPELAHEHTRSLAFALSQLLYRSIETPPFWKNDALPGGHIKDSNVIFDALDLAMEAESRYRKDANEKLKEKQEFLTNSLKNKTIEETPDADNVDVNDPETAPEVDL